MRGLEFILILLLGAAAFFAVKDDLRLRTANGQLNAALVAATGASQADTASASQGQLRCSREAAAGVKAGAAISRIAAPRQVSGQIGQLSRPMVGAADINAVVSP